MTVETKDKTGGPGQVNGAAAKAQIESLTAMSAEAMRAGIPDFVARYERMIKSWICCMGFDKIDTPEERKAVSKIIVDNLCKLGSAHPVGAAICLLPPARAAVEMIVLELLVVASKEGDRFCEGVACAPMPA